MATLQTTGSGYLRAIWQVLSFEEFIREYYRNRAVVVSVYLTTCHLQSPNPTPPHPPLQKGYFLVTSWPGWQWIMANEDLLIV